MLRNLLLWGALLVGGSGCFTFGAMQTASTLGKGNFSGGVEGTFHLIAIPNAQTARDYGLPQVTPYPEVNGFFRLGLSDRFDLGVRAGGTGIELTTKFMFTDPNERIVFSLAPSVSGYYLPSMSLMNADGTMTVTKNTGTLVVPVPLLFGYKLGDHELVAGLRLVNQIALIKDTFAGAPVTPGYILSLGGSIGFALRLGPSFILMPEIAVQAPVFATVSTPFGQASATGLGIVQASVGVGCMFGRFKPRASEAPPPTWEQEAPPAPMAPPQNNLSPPPQELPPDVAPPPPPPPMVPAADG